jgi:hypothetical protein
MAEDVKQTTSFAGVIRTGADGIKRLHVRSQRWYLHQISKFKDGEEVSLVVTNLRAKRSEAQNNYYWGVFLPIVADHTGERNLDRLHTLFKGKFLTTGVVDVLGQKVRMTRSTTELNKSQFCQFIIDIEAETGVEAPPTENYGLDPIYGPQNQTTDPEPEDCDSEVPGGKKLRKGRSLPSSAEKDIQA